MQLIGRINLGHWMRGAALALALIAPAAPAQINERPEFLNEVGLDEHLGARVPLELTFTDSTGKPVRLGDYFEDGRPVVLALVYYRCPVICTMVMEQMVESFNGLDYEIGKQFNVVYLSFDQDENASIALSKKNEIVVQYQKNSGREVTDHWGFLTGEPASVRQVADTLGFHYKRLPNGEYAHPIAFAVLAPDGTICRYFYGYDYPAKQMKLALLDASQGRVAQSIGDRVLHFCFQFDPKAGAYTLQAFRVMQLGGIVTLVFLATLVGGLLFVERRRRSRAAHRAEPAQASPPAPGSGDDASTHAVEPAGPTS